IRPELKASPLGPVLERALAKDPDARHGRARECADAPLDLDPFAIPSFVASDRSRTRYRYLARRNDETLQTSAPLSRAAPRRKSISERYADKGSSPSAEATRPRRDAAQAMAILQI